MAKKRTRKPRHNVSFFVEKYETSKGSCVSAFFDTLEGFGVSSITCGCGDPFLCSCEPVSYPHRRPFGMLREEFEEPRPFLMYLFKRFDGDPLEFIFMSKTNHEAERELKRLNWQLKRSNKEWYYELADEWNRSAITEYRDYQLSQME